MSRIAYVNGRYVPHNRASVSIEDRGYQFADGVYEVIEVHRGSLVDADAHLERLGRSLRELQIRRPLTDGALRLVLCETVHRNRVRDGMVYLQISRGVSPRDHLFPSSDVRSALVVTARSIDVGAVETKAQTGIKVITLPDIRWKRPDIKSISLLPNVLAKQKAKTMGGAEAWLYGADGLITEGAASNAWIIDGRGTVITHPVDQSILKGVTRTTLLRVIADTGLHLEERAFSVAEAYAASEAFITGATNLVMPVVAVDAQVVGAGRPGPVTMRLRHGFRAASALSRGF